MKEFFIIVLFVALLTWEEYRISQRDRKIKKWELLASIPPEDTISFNCVRCGQNNHFSLFPDSLKYDTNYMEKMK